MVLFNAMIFEFLSSYGPITGIIMFLITFGLLVLCLTVHEFAHAFIADRLGDPTPKAMGRLTLNPLAHLDPIGSALLAFTGFGWAKPVPFNPNYFANPRLYTSLTALAGPVSNFLFAILFAFLHEAVLRVGFGSPLVGIVAPLFFVAARINLVLGFFNLIPINPLDGFKVVWGLLPRDLALQWSELAQYGMYMLIFVILVPIGGSTLSERLVSVPVNIVMKLLF